jgi:2-polyprenyl-6-methoxyphenol hydroxylase-like FAD-dependent oxidoreductase
MDPIVRRHAAETPGVDLLLGETVTGLLPEGGVRLRCGRELRADLVVGADGRDSAVAELAGVPEKVKPHARFSYGAYYEGPMPEGAPDGTVWFLDPDWAAAFPTDNGLTMYACMLTHERLAGFKGDIAGALERFIAALPDAPPILESRRVSEPIGKIKMPNRMRRPVGDRLALVGDAALATDPIYGVGCGWAFQSAEWLVDETASAVLDGGADLERALGRYRRAHLRKLALHHLQINEFSSGRPLNAAERFYYRAGTRDPELYRALEAVTARVKNPLSVLTPRNLMRAALS